MNTVATEKLLSKLLRNTDNWNERSELADEQFGLSWPSAIFFSVLDDCALSRCLLFVVRCDSMSLEIAQWLSWDLFFPTSTDLSAVYYYQFCHFRSALKHNWWMHVCCLPAVVLVVVISSGRLTSPPPEMMRWDSGLMFTWFCMPSCAHT